MAKLNLSKLTHEQLELLAEDAEEFLNDLNVRLTSHSYENIIKLAIIHKFQPQVTKWLSN